MKKVYKAPLLEFLKLELEQGIVAGSAASKTLNYHTESDDKIDVVKWNQSEMSQDSWF